MVFTFKKIIDAGDFNVIFNTSGNNHIFHLTDVLTRTTTNSTLLSVDKIQTKLAVGWFFGEGSYTYWVEHSDYSTFDRDYNNKIYPRLSIENTFRGNIYNNGNVIIYNTTSSSSSSSGALIVSGGVGISGNVYVRGNIYNNGNLVIYNIQNNNNEFTGTNHFNFVPTTSINANANNQIVNWQTLNGQSFTTLQIVQGNENIFTQVNTFNKDIVCKTALIRRDNASLQFKIGDNYINSYLSTLGELHFQPFFTGSSYRFQCLNLTLDKSVFITFDKTSIQMNLEVTENVSINANTNSDSTTSGALVVNGGVGIAKDVRIGGSCYVTGSTTSTSFNATSDYRIKSNTKPLDSYYSVDKLKPISYHNIVLNKSDIGFFAHEVQEHFPCLVQGKKDDEEQIQSINYNGLIAVLVHEIQQIKTQMKKLQNQLDELTK